MIALVSEPADYPPPGATDAEVTTWFVRKALEHNDALAAGERMVEQNARAAKEAARSARRARRPS